MQLFRKPLLKLFAYGMSKMFDHSGKMVNNLTIQVSIFTLLQKFNPKINMFLYKNCENMKQIK